MTQTSGSNKSAPARRLERQTHFVAGSILILSLVLAKWVNPNWFALALLPTFGLMLDAISGICPMTLILKTIPWNATGSRTS